MGCACKENAKMQKMVNANNENHEKKRIWDYFSGFSETFINKLIFAILIVIVTPIVMIVILCNLIFGDKLEFNFPKKLTNYMKKIKNE